MTHNVKDTSDGAARDGVADATDRTVDGNRAGGAGKTHRAGEEVPVHKATGGTVPVGSIAPRKGRTDPREDWHPLLHGLVLEHDAALAEIGRFEAAIRIIRERGIDPERGEEVNGFFRFFDEDILAHFEREERDLFLLLQPRLLEAGNQRTAGEKRTDVEYLQSDHVRAMQLGSVVFNLFGLAFRLPDPSSRLLTLDLACEQAGELVDLLRVHFEREERIVYPLAHRHLSAEELDRLHEAVPPG